MVEADLARSSLGRRLPAQADAVLHMAQAYAAFPDAAAEIFEVNAGSTQRLAEYARHAGVRRFVLTSSGSVYRPSSKPLRESAPTRPSVYHPATKLMAETTLQYYGPWFSIGILRLFAPYGPGQKNRLIPRMIESVRSGQAITLSRGGEPRINPIYIDDLVTIVRQSLHDDASYTVNVAGPRALSMRQLAELIGRGVGRHPRFVRRDGAVAGDLIADTRLMERLFATDGHLRPSQGLARVLAAESGRRAED
jgi:nucleoside-diphosphate-sugar epimerase